MSGDAMQKERRRGGRTAAGLAQSRRNATLDRMPALLEFPRRRSSGLGPESVLGTVGEAPQRVGRAVMALSWAALSCSWVRKSVWLRSAPERIFVDPFSGSFGRCALTRTSSLAHAPEHVRLVTVGLDVGGQNVFGCLPPGLTRETGCV